MVQRPEPMLSPAAGAGLRAPNRLTDSVIVMCKCANLIEPPPKVKSQTATFPSVLSAAPDRINYVVHCPSKGLPVLVEERLSDAQLGPRPKKNRSSPAIARSG